jgi:uncharacterized membrane protein YphA (DoxX/SURF4 family)
MSHDFFADLERQLVEATPQRRQRLRRARVRRAAALSTVLVALLAAGAGLAAAVTGGGDGRDGLPASSAPPTVTHAPPPPAAATTVPSTVGGDPLARTFTVAVLNATTAPGLARGFATRLAAAGVKIGNVTNAATQDATLTEYHYVPGYRSKATLVSMLLRQVDRPIVVPATAADRAIAGRQAKVIVLVGSDQKSPSGP